jgi:hypothetical protein
MNRKNGPAPEASFAASSPDRVQLYSIVKMLAYAGILIIDEPAGTIT